MKKTQHFQRRRPHVLPPLPDIQPLVLSRHNFLQPDLVSMENRLGSPAPKKNVSPEENGIILDGKTQKTMIKIFESTQNKNGKGNSKFDVLPDIIVNEADNFHKIKPKNSPKGCELEIISSEEHAGVENNTSLEKNSNFESILPLKEFKNLKIHSDSNILLNKNCYRSLKPIDPY